MVNEKHSRAFDVTDVTAISRALMITADTGAYGTRGATTHVDNGSRRPFSEREANMTPKRAMLWLPKGGTRGLLFVERVGASHLTTNLEREVLRPLGISRGVSIRLYSYIDAEAWGRYIDEAEGYSVKSIWRPTTTEQRVEGNIRDEGELKMALSGGAASGVVQNLRAFLREKFRDGRTQPVEMELNVPPSLRPSNEEDFTRRRIEVQLDGPSGRRTLIMERDEPPAFVYPLGERLAERTLRNIWQEETERLSSHYGEDVLPPWQG